MKQRRFIALLAMVLVLVLCVGSMLVACNKCDGNHVDADKDGKCDVCDEAVTVTPTPDPSCEHEYDYACSAKCNKCGATRTDAAAHTYDNDCDATCNVCGEAREAAHVWATEWTIEDDVHYIACTGNCGATKDRGEHFDAEYAGVCDTCGKEIPVPDWDTLLNGVVAPELVPDAAPDVEGDFSMPTGNSYTLNDYMEAGPTNWNPHTWETNADSIFQSYAESAFVEPILDKETGSYKWEFEMAKNIQDVTALYALDDELRIKWGLVSGKGDNVSVTTANKVYRIYLNPNATWEDGTPINADTYIYSMKALLDPKMQNYRANTYYNGSTALKNAAKYFGSESPIYDLWVNSAEDFNGKIYINLNKSHPEELGDYTLNSLYADYGYGDGAALAALAPLANSYGYIEINEETMPNIKKAVKAFWGAFSGVDSFFDENGEVLDEVVYTFFGFYNTGRFTDAFDFENVGLVKVDDYTIDYVLENTETMFYFLTGMTSNWIVYEELYEGGKTQVGDLKATDYGTSIDTYMSYGPYKLVSYEKDKQIKLERNENWYGWTDGRHVGQYQMTNMNIMIVSDSATLEGLFLSGQIDGLTLDASQLNEYRNSEYLLKTDQTYTFRYIFATDLAKLTALEETRANGKNLKILSYDDFRKAISLAINRAQMCAQGTGGYKPAYALFNTLYYYDVENDPNSQYRNTEIAKQVILDLYGIKYGAGQAYATLDEAYEAVTGFDLAQAKELFQKVYDQAIEDGLYTAGQAIEIHCMATGADTLSEDDKAQERLLNEMIAAATVGTGLEGKVTFVFSAGAADRYGDVANGNIEMIRGAWGGAAFYPFSTIRCYTEPDYMGGLGAIHESCGWNPSTEMLTLTYDFDGDGSEDELTFSLQNWAKLINGTDIGEQRAFTDPDIMMFVFAKLEGAVLGSYQCIPFASETACSLFSQKIKYATLDYNIMYGYGGTRFMTFNYTDAEWEAYVAENNNQLEY